MSRGWGLLTREPSRLKVCAFWHSSITSFSRSLRLRYLWLRMRSCGRERRPYLWAPSRLASLCLTRSRLNPQALCRLGGPAVGVGGGVPVTSSGPQRPPPGSLPGGARGPGSESPKRRRGMSLRGEPLPSPHTRHGVTFIFLKSTGLRMSS